MIQFLHCWKILPTEYSSCRSARRNPATAIGQTGTTVPHRACANRQAVGRSELPTRQSAIWTIPPRGEIVETRGDAPIDSNKQRLPEKREADRCQFPAPRLMLPSTGPSLPVSSPQIAGVFSAVPARSVRCRDQRGVRPGESVRSTASAGVGRHSSPFQRGRASDVSHAEMRVTRRRCRRGRNRALRRRPVCPYSRLSPLRSPVRIRGD